VALSAIASHPNLSADNVKVLSFRDTPLDLMGQRIMKLNNPPAAKAYEVVMLGRGLHLIVVVVFIKVDFIHQPQFLEFLQGAVNRG
jgi:hypothetical protein